MKLLTTMIRSLLYLASFLFSVNCLEWKDCWLGNVKSVSFSSPPRKGKEISLIISADLLHEGTWDLSIKFGFLKVISRDGNIRSECSNTTLAESQLVRCKFPLSIPAIAPSGEYHGHLGFFNYNGDKTGCVDAEFNLQ